MCILHILIIIIVVFVKMVHAYNPYCNINCKKAPGSHTMCLFPGPDLKVCIDFNRERDRLQLKTKEEIVNIHNKLRNEVGLGRLENKPPAANMQQLQWDNELAIIAQRAADQCVFQHDKCRWVERFWVGQNVAIYRNNIAYPDSISTAINAWYGEHIDFPNSNKYQDTPKKTGHYTALVWATSRYIGCGRSRYKKYDEKHKVDMFCDLFFCNYGPTGNIVGMKVYEVGPPASQCPKGWRSNKIYRGLCIPWTAEGDGPLPIPPDPDDSSPRCSQLEIFLLILSPILNFVHPQLLF